jgi:hypothetical protein
MIESAAKHRLADEYDAAQERGEVAGHGVQQHQEVTLGIAFGDLLRGARRS